jgi:tetratricopeptide (TPR) repeat protein
MNTPAILDAVPVAELETATFDDAARLFEKALQAGPACPQIVYMLALAHKRRGNLAAARAALRTIADPDAKVVAQLALLSFREGHFVQSEEEFQRSVQLDPTSYAAGYNLMLVRLGQGKFAACKPMMVQLQALAASEDERRFLAFLDGFLERHKERGSGKPPPLPNGTPQPSGRAAMSPEEEARLLQILLGFGQMAAVLPLLGALAGERPASQPAQQAFATANLLHARTLVQRCDWEAASQLLVPVAAGIDGRSNTACRLVSKNVQMATYNLLGCCQCMLQEFERAKEYFSWAIKLSPEDPWLHQNLALACELNDQMDEAESHWNRYFELQGRAPAPELSGYRDRLAYEGCNRLADAFSKKERWNSALAYLQRACRIRPGDFDALERLFHMYNQVRRPEEARRTLGRLRELRPNDPQLELYELDLREIRTLEEIEKMLTDIRKILGKYPNDIRVEEKVVTMVGNIVPLLGRLCDQHTDQLSRIMDQVRRLPNYQINWSAVHDVMRDLIREFQKLRRIAGKCLALLSNEDHKRIVRELVEHIDKKIEICRQMAA